MIMTDAEYRLSPKALEDMEAVWLYSLSEWGTKQTSSYIDNLTEIFELLARNPHAGVSCEEVRTGYRKYHVTKHIVYYRVADYGVEVVRILHDKMLASRHI